jgi:hypothetical protein
VHLVRAARQRGHDGILARKGGGQLLEGVVVVDADDAIARGEEGARALAGEDGDVEDVFLLECGKDLLAKEAAGLFSTF